MTRRPDSLETLQLCLEVLRRIPKRGTITATELRQQLQDAGFEREPRTIQRLLESLSDPDANSLGIERDDSSKPYRYRWKDTAQGLSLPGLTTQESLLLTLAEQQLSSLLPARLMKSMDGFFTEARGQLEDKGPSEPERQWLDKVRVVGTSQPLLPPKVDAEVFRQVSDALYANQWLEVDYKTQTVKSRHQKSCPWAWRSRARACTWCADSTAMTTNGASLCTA